MEKTYIDNDRKVKRTDFCKEMDKVFKWYCKKKGWNYEKIVESKKSQLENWDKIQEFISILKDYLGNNL